MIDRAAIDAGWSRIAPMLDPVHGDREADALLRNRTVEQPGIERAIAHIDRTDTGALDALGHDFTRDALTWRRASEAV